MNPIIETIQNCLEDYNETLPEETIKALAEAIQICNESLHSSPSFSDIQILKNSEQKELEYKLRREETKKYCKHCKGTGNFGGVYGEPNSRSGELHDYCEYCQGRGYTYTI